MHYVLDTSDTFGGEVTLADMSRRLGYSYDLDFAGDRPLAGDVRRGEQPWDRARDVQGSEKFGYYRARTSIPGAGSRVPEPGVHADDRARQRLDGAADRAVLARGRP